MEICYSENDKLEGMWEEIDGFWHFPGETKKNHEKFVRIWNTYNWNES
jgi:hypothetical protein